MVCLIEPRSKKVCCLKLNKTILYWVFIQDKLAYVQVVTNWYSIAQMGTLECVPAKLAPLLDDVMSQRKLTTVNIWKFGESGSRLEVRPRGDYHSSDI